MAANGWSPRYLGGVTRLPAALLLIPLLAACAQDYVLTGEAVDVNPEAVTECPFTRVENTAFYRYDCNPVFSTTDEGWADSIGSTAFFVTEVLGHPFYQLWYTGYEESEEQFAPWSMGYAISPDGTEFTPQEANPVMDQPDKKDWDYDSTAALQVVWDPETAQYVMIYQGINDKESGYGLGAATSPDGQAWTRYAKNPVYDLREGTAEVQSWCWPLGLTLGDVAGYTGYIAGQTKGTNACEVYRLNASNVGDWVPSEKRVLPAGKDGDWDDSGFSSLAIAQLGDEKLLFYSGFGKWTRQGNFQVATNLYFGVAEEDDGEWDKWGDYIPLNNTEEGRVSAVSARTVGSRIHLWITDDYDDVQAVGYFLYDPKRAEAEDTE